jgi:hypothetical protein
MLFGYKIKTLKAYQKTSENNTSHIRYRCIAHSFIGDHSLHSFYSNKNSPQNDYLPKRHLWNGYQYSPIGIKLEG